MTRQYVLILAMTFVLHGCAAALVPYSSDPDQKLSNAFQLINHGRPIPAERLATEALTDYEEKKDYSGAANAHKVLGILYKSNAYRSFSKYFKEHGGYDPTNEKSIKHFRESAEFYKLAGDHWGVSSALVGVGDSYFSEGNNENACKIYKESLATYTNPNAVFTGIIHTWNPRYESYQEMVEALVDKACSVQSNT